MKSFERILKKTIGHVRQDVKKFRRIPKSNEVLQLHIQACFIPERTEVDIRCQNQM